MSVGDAVWAGSAAEGLPTRPVLLLVVGLAALASLSSCSAETSGESAPDDTDALADEDGADPRPLRPVFELPPLTEHACVERAPEPIGGSWAIGPMTGGVTSDTATLWLRTPEPASVDFEVSEFADLCGGRRTETVQTHAEDDYTAHVRFTGLRPDTRYYYNPRVDGRAVFEDGYPWFRTAPVEGRAEEFSFVVVTDFLNPTRPGPGPSTFRSAGQTDPSFVIVGGDLDHRNPGAEAASLGQARAQTRQMHRENLDWRLERRRDLADFLLRRASMTHLWDDHDFCCNDSDGTYFAREVSLQAYDDYFPSYSRPHPQAGIFQAWTWGHVDLFLLDGRFNRTPSRRPDGPDKTMLGEVQKAWLMEALLASTATWRIIISGSVFNPTVKCGADNWCEYRTEGRELTDFINDNHIRNVVILSGDIHAGAITNGRSSVYDTFWEMALPPADTGCDTTTFQAPDSFGEWTEGVWGVGYRALDPPRTCYGFGRVDVLTNPDRLRLSVLDEQGRTRLFRVIPTELGD